jgi:hypothetical protein
MIDQLDEVHARVFLTTIICRISRIYLNDIRLSTVDK